MYIAGMEDQFIINMLPFITDVPNKKLKSLKKIESSLKRLHLTWSYFNEDDSNYKDLIYQEYKKLHFKNNLYKVIIIKNLDKRYSQDMKLNFIFLWLCIFKTDIKIYRYSLFNNSYALDIIRYLDIHKCCNFSYFSNKLTIDDKKVIKQVEDKLTEAKIRWHIASVKELYDYKFVTTDGNILKLKNCKTLKAYLIDDRSFKKEKYISVPFYNLKYSLICLYKYDNKNLYYGSLMSKFCDIKFTDYIFSFFDDINLKSGYSD